MIVARAAAGVSWNEIADEAGISARQCQRVVEDRRATGSLLDAAPMDLVEDFARDFRFSIADYEALAWEYSGSNPTAALGAKKAADETRARLLAMLGNIGKLPSNMELFRSEAELLRLAQEMGDVLLALKQGDASVDEAIAFFAGLVMTRERRLLPAGSSDS